LHLSSSKAGKRSSFSHALSTTQGWRRRHNAIAFLLRDYSTYNRSTRQEINSTSHPLTAALLKQYSNRWEITLQKGVEELLVQLLGGLRALLIHRSQMVEMIEHEVTDSHKAPLFR